MGVSYRRRGFSSRRPPAPPGGAPRCQATGWRPFPLLYHICVPFGPLFVLLHFYCLSPFVASTLLSFFLCQKRETAHLMLSMYYNVVRCRCFKKLYGWMLPFLVYVLLIVGGLLQASFITWSSWVVYICTTRVVCI